MQNILFCTYETPSEKWPEIDKNYTLVPIIGPISYAKLSEIWADKKPLAVLTWKANGETYEALRRSFNLRKRWVHYNEPQLPEKIDVIPIVLGAVIGHQYDNENPLMSVFTTTYNSGNKIQRPLRSLLAQTYTNWEWIVWDDSEDDTTYKALLEMARQDLRIRVYKSAHHSGVIGEMKRLAASVAYGKFLVELDHDDDLHPRLLEWIKEAAEAHPSAGFFYTDCAEMTEETYEPATYGDFFAYGYSGHSFVWSDFHGRHIAQANVAPPNPVTLRHLIAMPNHVRAWRTEVYDRVGKHNPELSVADDYDLMIRTWAAEGVKWCHIRACGYYQYRNKDGNFTFIRNALIQHNVKHLYERHLRDGKIQACPQINNLQPQWKTDEYMYPHTHLEYVPREGQWDVTGVLAEVDGPEKVREMCERLEKTELDWRIFVFGEPLLTNLPNKWLQRIMWWNLSEATLEEKRRYFNKYVHNGKPVVVWG